MFLLLGSFHLIVGALCLVLVLLCILSFISIFAIILTKNRELIAFFQLSSVCLVTVRVMSLFLAVPLVGLQCVIVVFPDHGNLLSCQPGVTVTSCFVYKVIRDLELIDHLCIYPILRIGLIHT